MSNRQRNIRIQLRVTQQEKELIDQKMQELGTKNTEAYLRKMVIDGLIIHLDTKGAALFCLAQNKFWAKTQTQRVFKHTLNHF